MLNKREFRKEIKKEARNSTSKKQRSILYLKNYDEHINKDEVQSGCKCGTYDILSHINNGKIIIKCKKCKKIIVKLPHIIKWTPYNDDLARARILSGRCVKCGNNSYIGKYYISLDNKKYYLNHQCIKCGNITKLMGSL